MWKGIGSGRAPWSQAFPAVTGTPARKSLTICPAEAEGAPVITRIPASANKVRLRAQAGARQWKAPREHAARGESQQHSRRANRVRLVIRAE